jgi:hypothetical protein
MKIKNILNIVLFLIVTNAFSQESNSEFSKFKNGLLKSNIDLVVEYKSYCYGAESIELDNDCNSNAFYVFWLEDGNYFKNKFSNCCSSGIVTMNNPDFLITIKKNIDSIKNAEILPVKHSWKDSNGKEESVRLDQDHYCESTFIIYSDNQKITKIINEFYLDTAMIDENTTNDNFKSNQSSILNKMIRLVNLEIE